MYYLKFHQSSQNIQIKLFQKLNIALGGEYNNIYQHSRHIEIPHGESHLVFSYRIKRISDQLEKDIMVSAFNISSKPHDTLSQI